MLRVGGQIIIPENELDEQFIRASGPGGQNVNKVSSAVQLRFDVERSPSLPEPVRARLRVLAGRRLTGDGILVITAQRFRSQDRNREEARARLAALIEAAAAPPPPLRRPTRAGPAAKQRRLEAKSRRGRIKRLRSSDDLDD